MFLSCLCWGWGHTSLLFYRSYPAGAHRMLSRHSALGWTGSIWVSLRDFEQCISTAGITVSSPKSVSYLSGQMSSVPSLLCSQVWPRHWMSRSEACHFWAEMAGKWMHCLQYPFAYLLAERKMEPQEGRNLGYWRPAGRIPSQKTFIELQYVRRTKFYCVKPLRIWDLSVTVAGIILINTCVPWEILSKHNTS